MTPRFVYFDLDDTLLDHRRAERAALADVHAHYADHVGHHDLAHVQATYHAHNVPLWRDYGAGRITATDLKRLRSERLLTALGATGLDPVAFSDAYLSRYARHWHWLDGARDAYHRIADALPVGILTNGFREQQTAKLASLPEIADRAATVVISEDVGAMKPHPEVFAYATRSASEALGTALVPSDVLYVGDSYHSDVVGGTGYGWRVAWLGGDPDRSRDGTTVTPTWPDVLALLGL